MVTLLISLIFIFALIASIRTNKIELDSAIFFGFGYLLYCGLRDVNVGEDSINYFNNYFLTAHNYNSIIEFFSSNDVFFRFINYLLLLFSNNWYYYSFAMALICLILVVKINKSYFNSSITYFYTALIITNPVFIENTTNILRSSLCCLIVFLGYLSYDKNKTKGIIITTLGFLTHYFQGVLILCVFVLSRFNLIRTSKHLRIFTLGVLIVLVVKTFTSIFYTENISKYAELLNIYLSDKNIINYTLNQVVSDKTSITINMFFQILLYVVVPLFLVKFEDLGLRQKKILNVVMVAILSYLFLSPQFILSLRLVPICILMTTYLFTININAKKLTYIFSIILFNCVINIYNISQLSYLG